MEKKIHYVWLSDEAFPDKVEKCLNAWGNTHLDYELVKWDLNKFDMSKAPKYVQDAYKDKAWSFCTDYIRAYAVYNEGGWYADSDVMPYCRFLDNYNSRFIAGIEDYIWNNPYGGKNIQTFWNRIDKEGNNTSGGYIAGILMNPVLFGAEKGHPYLKDVMDYYAKLDYHNEQVDDGCLFSKPIAPQIFTKVLEKYGWKYINGNQHLDEGIEIVDNNLTRNMGEQPKEGTLYSLHMCSWGWLKNNKAKIR